MKYNFSDLNPASQREIYERLCAFDEAVEWVAKFSDLDIALVRQTFIGLGALETVDREQDEINHFWTHIDESDSQLP